MALSYMSDRSKKCTDPQRRGVRKTEGGQKYISHSYVRGIVDWRGGGGRRYETTGTSRNRMVTSVQHTLPAHSIPEYLESVFD